MRKRILFVAFLLLMIFRAEAQSIEFQADLKLQQTDIDYFGVKIDRKPGFEGGVFLSEEIENSENWRLRVGLLYSYLGFGLKDNIDGGNIGISYYFNEHSLKVPVLLEWHGQFDSLKPFFQVGFYSSYPLFGDLKAYGEDSDLRYKNASGKLDLGSIVSVGSSLGHGMRLSVNIEDGLVRRDFALGDEYVSVRNRGYSIVFGMEL